MVATSKCKKRSACPMCDDGSGTIDCTKCDGLGQICQSLLLDTTALECSKCKGTGASRCPDYEEDTEI